MILNIFSCIFWLFVFYIGIGDAVLCELMTSGYYLRLKYKRLLRCDWVALSVLRHFKNNFIIDIYQFLR